MQNQVELEKIILEARKKLTMTGVLSVDGFSEQTINLTLVGNKVKIVGEGLKVNSFNKGTGTLTVDGIVSEIKFGYKKTPILKRVFK